MVVDDITSWRTAECPLAKLAGSSSRPPTARENGAERLSLAVTIRRPSNSSLFPSRMED